MFVMFVWYSPEVVLRTTTDAPGIRLLYTLSLTIPPMLTPELVAGLGSILILRLMVFAVRGVNESTS